MHKKVFMYGWLTITISLGAVSDLPVHERAEQSELSVIAGEKQPSPCAMRQEANTAMSEGAIDRVAPTITVSIHDNGPIEATFSLSDSQTKYVTGLAALLLICCTVVATQNAELVVRLLGQK